MRRLEIPDGKARSRLFLLLRKISQRIATDRYAVNYLSGTRSLTRIGYPAIGLSTPRKAFRHNFSSMALPLKQRARRFKQSIDPAMIDLLIAAANLDFAQEVPVAAGRRVTHIPATNGNVASAQEPKSDSGMALTYRRSLTARRRS